MHIKKIIIATMLASSLILAPSAIAQIAVSPQAPVQAQVDKRELIAIAARATEDKNYQLALRVSDNVIELFPKYGTGYLNRAIALYKLGELEAALAQFGKAKQVYQSQLLSNKITSQAEKEAALGLETAELHLKLLKSQL